MGRCGTRIGHRFQCQQRRVLHWGGHFLGNALEKLFENIGFLEGYLDRYPLLLPYIVAMKSFNEVRKSCFGMDLHDDYAERIHKFQADQKVLQDDFGFSVTVKAHCLFYHFIPWLDKWQLPLGLVSEQTGESIHCRFHRFIQNKQVSNPNSKDFAENLLKVVNSWNSRAAILFEDIDYSYDSDDYSD